MTHPPASPRRRKKTAAKPKRSSPGVVHVVAEYWPFARTGGLAEAVRGLANYQASRDTPCSVVLPLHRSAREAAGRLVPVGDPFAIKVGPRREVGRLWRLPHKRGGPRVYFIDHPDYFDRAGIYGEAGSDYPDNVRRFAFFSMAVVECLEEFGASPVVLHAHDWHTALAPVYLRTHYAGRAFHDAVACVMSVHNAGFQGHFPFDSLTDAGLPESLYNWQQLEWYDKVNWLKGGLTFSEMAVTVSPTHAHELRTAFGGFGLHDTFIGLKTRLVGILNGIDTAVWDPESDDEIAAHYTIDDVEGKSECKTALQRELGLPVHPRTPIFGMTARLVAQKGLDLILQGNTLSSLDAQFVFLGEGEPRYETALRQVAQAMPDRVAVETNFREDLEHRLIAGSDMLLMPSLYEPCGLTQMRAQRYGAVPVARRVGGLADTIEDGVTGFLFDEYAPQDLDVAARRAVDHYTDPTTWAGHIREGMRREYGWALPAARYAEVYHQALSLRGAKG